jgi:tetratricopeptide (TPR) repeat protein
MPVAPQAAGGRPPPAIPMPGAPGPVARPQVPADLAAELLGRTPAPPPDLLPSSNDSSWELSVDLPMSAADVGLPTPAEPEARRRAAAPPSAGVPGAPPPGTNVKATLTMLPELRPDMQAVTGRPSPRPIPPEEVGLPGISAGLPVPVAGLPAVYHGGVGLPQVSAGLPQVSAGLPQVSASLPQIAAGLPQMAAGLPMNAAGLPMNAAGLPMNAAGLPMGAAGLPMGAANLPMNAAGLPMGAANLPMNAAGLPMGAADLPMGSAELPGLEPDLPVSNPRQVVLGRVNVERRAFTMTDSEDLPSLAGDAALPSVRAPGPNAVREEYAVSMDDRNDRGFGHGGVNYGELDLGDVIGQPMPPSGPAVNTFQGNPFPSQGQGQGLDFGQEFDALPGAAGRGYADPGAQSIPAPSTKKATPAKKEVRKAAESDGPRRPWMQYALYGTLGVLGVGVLGGAALATTEYGAFGKNWFDEQLHGPERHAAATRAIQYVDRLMEHDTYDRAIAGLRRVEQALARVPKERELKAYIVYANNLVVLRFGADPSRTGRARTLLAELAEAPPGMQFLALAKASDALARGNPREALRLARNDPNGRDLATMAAAALNDNAQWLRYATAGRQRHPTARSRYLLAQAYYATGDVAAARRMAEETLQHEAHHPGARVMLARIVGQREEGQARALSLLQDLVGTTARGSAVSYASPTERADACVVAGQIEMSRDRVTVAQTRFQRALELEPRSATALVGIGSILYRQGNFTDAQARFRNAHSADPQNLDAIIGIAQSTLSLNQPAEAKAALEPAVQEHPNDGRLHYWLGRSLAATNDQRSLAQQSFREAIRLQPDNLDAYVSLSELLIAMQRNDAADQVLVEARARVPDNAAIHRALAHGRLARGDVNGAEQELRVALQRDPEDVRAHYALGDVYRRMQRLDDATRQLDTVARIDPDYPGLALARGRLAEARGELPEALATFREALARDPTNPELINRVAATLVALGNFGDADQMLRSVVVSQPTNAEAQYLMGRARLGAGNYVDSVHYLDRAIELNPLRAEFKAFAAEAHRRSGDIVRAIQLAEESIQLDPSFPRGYWVRAEIRVRQGAAAQALVDINRATQLDQTFWDAYATWADIDDALGRRDDAIRLYQIAVSHDPRHGDWFYNLGRLLGDAGRSGEARAALLQVRALGAGLNPTPSWFVQGTRQLADLERASNPAEARRLYIEYLRMVPPGSPSSTSVQIILGEMSDG